MSDQKIPAALGGNTAGHRPSSVAERLARRVIGGEWAAGAALPTEIALAEELGVARTSVREALSRLKAKGLIASRQKAGTRVLPRVQWNMLDEDVLRWSDDGEDRAQVVEQLMQMRRIVEPAACEIAAASAPDSAIAAIERAYRAMDAAGMDATAYAGPDLEFHQAILAATGNRFLISFGATIQAALRLSFAMSSHQPGAPRRSLPLHREVLDQIWARKPEAARQAMANLLGLTESNLQRGATQVAAGRRPRSA